MTAILGISAFYHDSAAALVIDGQVVAAAQQERFSRRKHDASFPKQAIEFCLEYSGLEIEDLDHVVFYEKPFLKFERILETHLAFAPRGLKSFSTSMPIWMRTKLHLSRRISKGLDHRYGKRIIFPEHHQSHAASAFLPSPYEQAAILTVDGVGEWATTTLGIGNGNQIELIKQLSFPDSLGLLYSAFTSFCGFRVNGGEGKLMGLAPYGTPNHADTILDQLIDLKEDGSFRLNQDFFNYCTGDTMTSRRFENLFGGSPRIAGSTITQREKDLAASIQAVIEIVLVKMATHLHGMTGMKNLCIAGGVGLNCVANGRLLRDSPFENIWVSPAAGDSGGAIGAALFVWHQLLGNERIANGSRMPFLGPSETGHETQAYLEENGAVYQKIESDDRLIDVITDRLLAQETIGWLQGRMEFGPRALGNRSILADPRSEQMQETLNKKIKFRELFRPFAPAVPAERCQDYFELDQTSPYMSMAAFVKPTGTDTGHPKPPVPAITHVDGSARIQTVSEPDNALLYALLKRFEQETGCPMLVNTSFNVRGEPIVCSVHDAYRCFLNSGLDVLVVGNFVLLKTDQPNNRTLPEPSEPAKSFWQRLVLIWTVMTFPLRWLVSKVVLALVFFLLVTPIALITRNRTRRSFMEIEPRSKSYWQSRKPTADKSRYFKQY